jgi:hypothetical protein
VSQETLTKEAIKKLTEGPSLEWDVADYRTQVFLAFAYGGTEDQERWVDAYARAVAERERRATLDAVLAEEFHSFDGGGRYSPIEYRAYNDAVRDCAAAIRNLAPKES